MNRLALELIKRHEGANRKNGRHVPYRCTSGALTIGYGTQIEDGIDENEAVMLLIYRAEAAEAELELLFGDAWDSMPMERRAVLIDMMYQLGSKRFRSFKRFIQAVRIGDLPGMVKEMLDSKWATQTPGRVEDLIRVLGARA
jgi:lysozyme